MTHAGSSCVSSDPYQAQLLRQQGFFFFVHYLPLHSFDSRAHNSSESDSVNVTDSPDPGVSWNNVLKIWKFGKKFLYLHTKQVINKMTAIDLRANTMQILDQFDKADASLWQKVLDAVTLIYKGEKKTLHTKRAEQKAKIRQMVGILNEDSLEDWKREKEEYLAEKYQ